MRWTGGHRFPYKIRIQRRRTAPLSFALTLACLGLAYDAFARPNINCTLYPSSQSIFEAEGQWFDQITLAMRVTLRLLADVKAGRYLRPGHPTGLTGLFNHPSPRSTLIYLYGSTLNKLENFPEHSVYRQSAEAITKHRMQIIKSIKPEGYDEWATKAIKTLRDYPEAFMPGGRYVFESFGGEPYISLRKTSQYETENANENENENEESTSSEEIEPPAGEPGEMTEMQEIPGWESEPPLEASQCVCTSGRFALGMELTYCLQDRGCGK